MKHPVRTLAVVLTVAVLMGACATPHQPVPPFTPVDVEAGGPALKTQNVIVIMDASSSMGESYQQRKKLDVATAVVRNMADTVPADMGIKSGLRIFGGDPKTFSKSTSMVDDVGDVDKALSTVTTPGGTSPLGKAAAAVVNDLEGLDGTSMDLSDRRAKAVVDYRVGKGVAPSRLSAQGYGPDRPIADNATKLGRSKNRRVQFTQMN